MVIGEVSASVPAEKPSWWEGLRLDKIFSCDNLQKIIGKLGVFGNAFNVGSYIAQNRWDKVLKSINKTVGDFAKIADKGAKATWADVFKTGKQVKKVGKKATESVGGWGKVAKFTGWVDKILTVGENAYDNYNEFGGDLSNGRMWSETIVESTIDIGVGAAVTAGVAALGATVGAPVVAVGVATAAVSIAVDWGLSLAFGDDWKEKTSDAIIDFGEKAAKAVGDSAKSAMNAAKAGFNKVCSWASSIFSGKPKLAVGGGGGAMGVR